MKTFFRTNWRTSAHDGSGKEEEEEEDGYLRGRPILIKKSYRGGGEGLFQLFLLPLPPLPDHQKRLQIRRRGEKKHEVENWPLFLSFPRFVSSNESRSSSSAHPLHFPRFSPPPLLLLIKNSGSIFRYSM